MGSYGLYSLLLASWGTLTVSKLKRLTKKRRQEFLDEAIQDALDAAFDFGFEEGLESAGVKNDAQAVGEGLGALTEKLYGAIKLDRAHSQKRRRR